MRPAMIASRALAWHEWFVKRIGSVDFDASIAVRGGIYTNVVAEHRKKGWTPAPRVDLPAANLGAATGLL